MFSTLHALHRTRPALAAVLTTLLVAACGGSDPGSASATAQVSLEGRPNQRALAVGRIAPGAIATVSVEGMALLAERRISRTVYEYDYRLTLRNAGTDLYGVAVQITATGPGTTVVDGAAAVDSLLAGGASAATADTITLRHDRLLPFAPGQIAWSVSAAGGIRGTAAVGAALANANVSVTDTAGANVCAEARVVTNGIGNFDCTVRAGVTAPFLVVVTEPFGAYPPMVSVVATAPAAGSVLVASATPLTTAIVGQLAPNGNALSVLANPALLNLATLANITAKVLTQIAPVLAAVSAPPGYNPFTTPIIAGTANQAGNTADAVIEMLRFFSVNGVPQISTVDNPAGAVPIAGPNTANPLVLAAPAPGALGLAQSLRLFTDTYNQCFALPVASRALAVNTSIPTNAGGPSVTQMAPACAAVARANYLQGGFAFGQRYYGLLRDAKMVGAKFSLPEVMLYIDDTSVADNDVAVLNFRFLDNAGVADNLIEVLRKIPGSATAAHASDWWIQGNGDPIDSLVRSYVRRSEQLVPNPGQAPFQNAGASRFEAGIEVFINKDGPGSAGMRAARVKGPGLPPAGLVYTRPDPAAITDQNWLNIRRKDGAVDPASATFSNAPNIFVLHRTQGTSGAAASATQPNPNAGNANNTQFVNWAHPLDYGAALGTATEAYVNFAALKAHNTYTFEIYYDGEVAPRHVLSKIMLTAVTPATFARNLEWVDLSAATKDYLNPAHALAASQTTMTLNWMVNPFAETVRSAGVYTLGGGQSINSTIIGVSRGATTATATAPAGFAFPALTNDGSSGRTIQLRYRMLDGAYKDSMTRFN